MYKTQVWQTRFHKIVDFTMQVECTSQDQITAKKDTINFKWNIHITRMLPLVKNVHILNFNKTLQEDIFWGYHGVLWQE